MGRSETNLPKVRQSTGVQLREVAQIYHGAPLTLWTLGEASLLDQPLLGLAGSVRCPGDAILGAMDTAVALRERGVGVIGGFSSPMEVDALRLLLRGSQPVVLCLARGLQHLSLKPEWREPLAEGRLLLLSPFGESVRRTSRATAQRRNRVVAALAQALLIIHAQPGSQTESLARTALEWGKVVYALDVESNGHLWAMGVRRFGLEEVAGVLSG